MSLYNEPPPSRPRKESKVTFGCLEFSGGDAPEVQTSIISHPDGLQTGPQGFRVETRLVHVKDISVPFLTHISRWFAGCINYQSPPRKAQLTAVEAMNKVHEPTMSLYHEPPPPPPRAIPSEITASSIVFTSDDVPAMPAIETCIGRHPEGLQKGPQVKLAFELNHQQMGYEEQVYQSIPRSFSAHIGLLSRAGSSAPPPVTHIINNKIHA
eukprot:1190092-Prorocentrum_minimum.AAC.2